MSLELLLLLGQVHPLLNILSSTLLQCSWLECAFAPDAESFFHLQFASK